MKKNKIHFKTIQLFLISLLLLTSLPSLAKQSRYALVIGNGNYAVGKLKNPANDARDMSSVLKQQGFIVTQLINANQRQMEEAISSFSAGLEEGSVGLFYYAGHGVEVNGNNYLIPIGANIDRVGDIKYETVNAGRVLDGMKQAGNNLNLVILDACRNNPYARSFRSSSRGLTRMTPASGSLILYATEPGQVAADGDGRNGVFTQQLLRTIKQPGISVEQAFKKTAKEVKQATAGMQTPWMEGVILGEFQFVAGAPSVKENQPISTSSRGNAELIFWNSVEAKPTKEGYQAYLDSYPKGNFIALARVRVNEFNNSVSIPNSLPTAKPVSTTHIDSASRQSFEPEMVSIPGGSFRMGSKYRKQHKPIHMVNIKPFLLGKTEVTKGQFEVFIKDSNYVTESEKGIGCRTLNNWTSSIKVEANWRNPHLIKRVQMSSDPVVCLSWADVQAYISWLNNKTGKLYRLPSESEWEYAARAGTTTWFSWGNKNDCTKMSHTKRLFNSCGKPHPEPVASYSPNPFGLYDMHGNVEEWIQDCWHKSYSGAPADGSPWESGDCSKRIIRSGDWYGNGGRSYARRANEINPNDLAPYNTLGVRLARDI